METFQKWKVTGCLNLSPDSGRFPAKLVPELDRISRGEHFGTFLKVGRALELRRDDDEGAAQFQNWAFWFEFELGSISNGFRNYLMRGTFCTK